MSFQKLWPLIIIYRKWVGAFLVAAVVMLTIATATSHSSESLVIARHNIPAGTKISSSDLKLVEVSYLWDDAITNSESAIGLRSVTSISSGQPLSKSALRKGEIFDPQHPSAVKVSLPKSASASDLNIGSRVDVYAKPDSAKVRKIFSNALVINASKGGWNPMSGSDQGVSLAVMPDQVQLLAELSESTSYTFVTLAK